MIRINKNAGGFIFRLKCWSLVLVLVCWTASALAALPERSGSNKTPNILFIILDDVGIDQMETFGYGGATPPRLPTIETIANEGVSFRNFWAMPECSPSRALMFEGRYPLRTNVQSAILSVDLANSQVSPYETTTPKVLRERGYESALFGKFHLTGSNLNAQAVANNPLGYTAVTQLGWDFFAGWQDGAPHPIDATAGGVAPDGVVYDCGFVPNTLSDNGADAGACYFVDGSCEEITVAQAPTPGRACMERGGILEPNAICHAQPPSHLDFSLQNGYYAGEFIINYPDGSFEVIPPEDPSGIQRGYRTTIEADWAIDWINSRPEKTPWMATLSFSSAHTPFQQAPASLLAEGTVPTGGFSCESSIEQLRVLSNQMIEAMDAEITRVLVETGIAIWQDGELHYNPEDGDTMVVVLGDNGTYAPGVKAPFNPARSKGTVYQTGVWAPLIVAGPLVQAPGREVNAMVNVADVFQLFGEMAGLDVHKIVPGSRPLDSESMLPYLTKPQTDSIRKTNFAQTATNIKADGLIVEPCVLEAVNACIQLFPSQALCESEGGTWWGTSDNPSPGDPPPQPDCCGVNEYRLSQSESAYMVLPEDQLAIRNDDYKLVKIVTSDWDPVSSSCATTETTEFYAIDQDVPPKLDNGPRNLLSPPHILGPEERLAKAFLERELQLLLDSHKSCPGDGNQDGWVNLQDLEELEYWASLTGFNSSWYDFNLDGHTDEDDVPYITTGRFPRACPGISPWQK